MLKRGDSLLQSGRPMTISTRSLYKFINQLRVIHKANAIAGHSRGCNPSASRYSARPPVKQAVVRGSNARPRSTYPRASNCSKNARSSGNWLVNGPRSFGCTSIWRGRCSSLRKARGRRTRRTRVTRVLEAQFSGEVLAGVRCIRPAKREGAKILVFCRSRLLRQGRY